MPQAIKPKAVKPKAVKPKQVKRCYECGGNHKVTNCRKNIQQICDVIDVITTGIVDHAVMVNTCKNMSKIMLLRVAFRATHKEKYDQGSQTEMRLARHGDSRATLTRNIMSYYRKCATAHKLSVNETLDNAVCPICYENFDVLKTALGELKVVAGVTTSCGHSFCVSCYTNTIAARCQGGYAASCPMCRMALL